MFGLGNLFDLLDRIGNLGDLGLLEKVQVGQQIFAALQALPAAETSRDYHAVAIAVLRPVAPLTVNDLDDGALIALEALARDDGWHDWVNNKLAALATARDGAASADAAAADIPEGALAITDGRDLPDWTRQQVEAMSLGGSLVALAKYLPLLLQLIAELRRLGGQPQPALE